MVMSLALLVLVMLITPALSMPNFRTPQDNQLQPIWYALEVGGWITELNQMIHASNVDQSTIDAYNNLVPLENHQIDIYNKIMNDTYPTSPHLKMILMKHLKLWPDCLNVRYPDQNDSS
ncbi:Uncharacterised protein [uncultured archaeon]|nr:Uncharacterised protein [uncultured archaeon]